MGDSEEDRQYVYKLYLLDEKERQEDEAIFKNNKNAIGDKVFLRNLASKSGRLSARKVGRPRQPPENN